MSKTYKPIYSPLHEVQWRRAVKYWLYDWLTDEMIDKAIEDNNPVLKQVGEIIYCVSLPISIK